jgi:hypothetical protein
MADGKRPFWMHQLVEYLLGGALVASGAQSHTPLVPAVLGTVILVHAAITRGALSAFRVLDRRVHRVSDPVLILLCVAGALQPWISVASPTRLIVLLIAGAMLIVYLTSSFHERQRKVRAPSRASGDRSTDLGRAAGRMVGTGVNAARRWRDKASDR